MKMNQMKNQMKMMNQMKINEDHQLVTVMLAPAEDQYVPSAPVTKNQPMYEHETVNACVC